MPQDRSLCVALLAEPAVAREGDTVAGFSGVAYSGGVVPNYGWHGDMAIDLATLNAPAEVPILLNHDPDQIVGRARVSNDGRQLVIEQGAFSRVTEQGQRVAALMAEGHPWALSVGVNGRVREADRSKPTQMNGRALPVDTVLGGGRLLEVSFVPAGADPNAYAARLSARMGIQPPEQPMADPQQPDIVALQARIAELEAQNATLTTERDAARTELATVALNARNAEITALFGAEHGLTDAQIDVYRGMTAAQFNAVRDAVAASRQASDPALFRQVAVNGRAAGDEFAASPLVADAKRRAEAITNARS